MSKAQNRPYFILLCSEEELKGQLAICLKTEYRIETDADSGEISVYDQNTRILRAEELSGHKMLWLHRQYYRHPFGSAPDGEALPGIP
jgi:hypothetical protein